MDHINKAAIEWANENMPTIKFEPISDPFPEHTKHQEFLKSFSKIDKLFGLIPNHSKPKDITIWEAYQMGYEAGLKETK